LIPIVRYPADWPTPRMWALRHDLRPYDATYIAFTEMTAANVVAHHGRALGERAGVRCTLQLL
jgi:predicted nucleic acid-binding protein